MKPFRFLAAVGLDLTLLLSGAAAEAQQPPKTARVGTLSLSAGPNPNMDVFVGLRELGWVEGQNLTVQSRWAAGQEDRLPALAAELVRLKLNVIVTASTPAARAAKQATSTILIVITFVADGAIGDQVGRYEIEHIDVDAIVHQFVFDTGVLLAAALGGASV